MNVCSALTTCIYNLSESVVPCDASNINIIRRMFIIYNKHKMINMHDLVCTHAVEQLVSLSSRFIESGPHMQSPLRNSSFSGGGTDNACR